MATHNRLPLPTAGAMIPSTLARPGAAPFWLAVLLTGIGTGIAAAALTRLLEMVQHIVWNGSGTNLLDAAEHAGAWTAHSGAARRRRSDWRGADRPEATVQRQRNRHYGRHLVPCGADAGLAHFGQRRAFRDHRWHGRVAGPRGRAETSRRGDRQLLFGQSALVRRTTPASGGLRRGSRDGRGLWRAVGRRAFRAGGDARACWR